MISTTYRSVRIVINMPLNLALSLLQGQQLDLRPSNSWTAGLRQVPLQELLQTLTINSVAPFLLVSSFQPLLLQSPNPRKFVVNVSAMEGQFSRVTKGCRHPHTNMAKAALNMLTRTSGLELQQVGGAIMLVLVMVCLWCWC